MEFFLSDIKRFYTAVVIKSGYEDETTEVSLEWFESEGRGRVELLYYGIFITTKDGKKHQFLFKTRDELDIQMSSIIYQIE